MQNLNAWTDDHLPCVGFDHNGFHIEVNWTEKDVYGKLELVESGDITIEKALKKYPHMLAIINNPRNCPESGDIEVVEADARSDDTLAEYIIDHGYVNVMAVIE